MNTAAYDDTCTDDIECVAVVFGDVCECGDHCAAIARSEREQYDADVNELTGCGFSVAPSCPNGDNPFAVCAARDAACNEGRCVVVDER